MKKALLFSLYFACGHLYSQTINTVAGDGGCCNPQNGVPATTSTLFNPNGVAVDSVGNIYISESNQIRKVDTQGIINTIAGSFGGYSGDGGLAVNALLNSSAVAVDKIGNIYTADWYHDVVRKIDTMGIINTVAGNGLNGFSGDGGPATAAKLNNPNGIAVDNLGNFYIADTDNGRIRKVNSVGIITTIAGHNVQGYNGDGIPATSASLQNPIGITFDNNGNLYIADWQNDRVRKVNTSGIISTVAGNGTPGFSGDGGLATAAEMRQPSGVACDSFGNLFISEDFNNRVRVVNQSGIINTIAGNGVVGYNGDGILATTAELYQPWSVAVDMAGTLYIGDKGNYRIRTVNNPVGINEINRENQIYIYPNPYSIQTTLQSNTLLRGATLNIINYIGQTVKQINNISGQKLIIQRDNLPKGIYLLRLSQDNKIIATNKLIIID